MQLDLSSDLIDKYFFGTASKVEGINLDEIEEETIRRHIKRLLRMYLAKKICWMLVENMH